MGKWLDRLQEYSEKNLICPSEVPTKPTKDPSKVLLYPFVTSCFSDSQKNTSKSIDQEKAESLIDSLKLRDDRIFVRRCLLGIYGTKRLQIMEEYLARWKKASDAEPVSFRKENAGRRLANTWIRGKLNND